MIQCFEESAEGVRVFTERGEFVLATLTGGELYDDEVVTVIEYGYTTPPGYATKKREVK